MICELKISACIPPLQNMHPPPIYSQHLLLHEHGLAILACITPFQNMCPPWIFTLNQSIPFNLKWCFWRSDFSLLNTIKTPKSSRHGAYRKERERERKRMKNYWKREREKLQEFLQIKGEANILRGKHFNFENPFYMIPFSPPPSNHFENLFQIIEKVFITLFGPSFSLAI
jgi:hypothetical protein